jgi:hypothetical protein
VLLKPFLTGFDIRDPDYGYILGIESRRINPIVVGCLMPFVEPDDILICHSNGCAIAYDLMRLQAVKGAAFIDAALEQNITRPAGCDWIDCYYNPDDTVTEAAKLGAALGLTDLCWGEMGHAGYSGSDSAIMNINCGATDGMPIVRGHSDFFTAGNLAWWGPYLAKRIASRG